MKRLLLLVVFAGVSFAQTTKPHLPSPGQGKPVADPRSLETISPEQYRERLLEMQRLVSECRKAISASHCPTDAVSGDSNVSFPAEARTVRFGWLRSLMDEAAHYEPPKSQPAETKKTLPAPPVAGSQAGPKKASPATEPDDTTDDGEDELADADAVSTLPERLDQARDRLSQDLKAVSEAEAEKATAPGSVAAERQALTAILAGKEYHGAVVGRTLKDRVLEKIAQWINRAIDKIASVGAKSKWIGVTAEIGFVTLLCVALVWFLIRLEKQGRFGSAMFHAGAGVGAPSERDWQLWLKDARAAANSGAWREAIHYLYWASISRLESNGMWRADRARTPREYVALLSGTTGQRVELTSRLRSLTRSFEQTWYGGKPAGEADFERAEQLAAGLGAGLEASSEGRGAMR